MANEDVFNLGVKLLVFNPEGKVLLLRVNKMKLSGYTGDAYWDIPGGRVQRGQGIIETLERELFEETGLDLKSRTVLFVGSVVSNIRIPIGSCDVGLILFLYNCQWDETPKLHLSSEHTEYWWASPEEATQALLTKYPPEIGQLLYKSTL